MEHEAPASTVAPGNAPVLDYRSAVTVANKVVAPLEPGEVCLYADDQVMVTDARLVVVSKSYALSHVICAEMGQRAPMFWVSIAADVMGVLLLAMAMIVVFVPATSADKFAPVAVFAVVTLIIALFCFYWGHRRIGGVKQAFSLLLQTSAGRFKAFETDDEARVCKIWQAVNAALARRR